MTTSASPPSAQFLCGGRKVGIPPRQLASKCEKGKCTHPRMELDDLRVRRGSQLSERVGGTPHRQVRPAAFGGH